MIKKRNVIITGANRGIGMAMLNVFARSGYNVWACARKHSSKFESMISFLSEEYGVWIKPVYFDLTNFLEIDEGIKFILDTNEPIDVLINNAGVSAVGLLNHTKIEDIELLFKTNYFAMLRIIQKVSKRMARQKRGCIINMGSIAGMEPQAGKIAYGSSKAAVILMTRCLAKELGPIGVRVNSIAPGPIETEMIHQYSDDMLSKLALESSLRRLGRAEEIANVALFLASDNASYINGEIIKVDGGR